MLIVRTDPEIFSVRLEFITRALSVTAFFLFLNNEQFERDSV